MKPHSTEAIFMIIKNTFSLGPLNGDLWYIHQIQHPSVQPWKKRRYNRFLTNHFLLGGSKSQSSIKLTTDIISTITTKQEPKLGILPRIETPSTRGGFASEAHISWMRTIKIKEGWASLLLILTVFFQHILWKMIIWDINCRSRSILCSGPKFD
jgi:hypothetical protein